MSLLIVILINLKDLILITIMKLCVTMRKTRIVLQIFLKY